MEDTSMQVELYFNGRNLKDTDFFSKSDPYVKLYMQRSFLGNLDYIGRTQTINNNVNPNWKTKIDVQYYFEMQQPLKIEVYDQDDSKNSDFIGKVETTLGKIMGSVNQAAVLALKDNNGKNAGNIIVRAQKVQESSQSFRMKWKGGKIANVDSFFDFWDKSDPYLKFLKIRGDNTYLQAARTQVKNNNQQPSWNQIVIPMNRLVNANGPVSQFKVQCWDHEQKDHEHQFIGQIFVSLEDIKKPCPIDFTMHNPKIKKPGKLTLEKFGTFQTPSFIDYLKSGLQLNLVIAVDFTGSNGTPTSQTSLHYLNPNQPTQYQIVMNSIWGIIQNYDSDKRIPAFGFGAIPKFKTLNQTVVNHCFPLSGDYDNIQIQGFENLNQAYIYSVKNVSFSGPTVFGPLLNKAFIQAKRLQGKYSYQVLLILTDGEIHDMKDTVDIIVQNSHLPMSIIIVGIGNANFQNMNKLDGDQGLYSSTGKKCPRDIVQFVPFNKFGGNSAMMSQQLLKQLPKQVVQYMVLNGMQPQPKPPIDIQSMLPSQNKGNMVQNVYGMMKQ